MPNIRIPGLFWRKIVSYTPMQDKLIISTEPQKGFNEADYRVIFLPNNAREATVLGNMCYRLADQMRSINQSDKQQITKADVQRAKNDPAYFAELIFGKKVPKFQAETMRDLTTKGMTIYKECPRPFGFNSAPNFLTQASCGIGKSAFVDLGVKPRIIIDELSKFTEPKTTKWSTNYLTKRKAARRPGVVRWSRARTNRLKRR